MNLKFSASQTELPQRRTRKLASFAASCQRTLASIAAWFVLLTGVLYLGLGRENVQAQPPSTSEEVIDRLIAIVGDEIILESEVFQSAQQFALQQGLDASRNPAEFENLQKEVLQELINQKVLLAKAREDSISVEPRDVDRELENRLQQIIQNVGSEQKLEELYGYSLRRIRRDFRATVEENLLVEKVRQGFLQEVKITRTEALQYFKDHPEAYPPMREAVELAHLLREATSSGAAETRALARADSLYDAIKNGAAFDSLARRFSEDPASAKNNGSIGWTERGDLLTDFEQVAYALKPGEISRPVKTRYGFHVIRLDDRKDESIATSHILIKIKTSSDDEKGVLDSLLSYRQQMVEGLPFEEAISRWSQDLESVRQGGYLGWFAIAEMPEEFRASVDTLQINQLSLPFKTQYGFHIVKLLNRQGAREIKVDQDWELIQQRALNAKREREYEKWLTGLKARYFIEIKS